MLRPEDHAGSRKKEPPDVDPDIGSVSPISTPLGTEPNGAERSGVPHGGLGFFGAEEVVKGSRCFFKMSWLNEGKHLIYIYIYMLKEDGLHA